MILTFIESSFTHVQILLFFNLNVKNLKSTKNFTTPCSTVTDHREGQAACRRPLIAV